MSPVEPVLDVEAPVAVVPSVWLSLDAPIDEAPAAPIVEPVVELALVEPPLIPP